MTKSERDFMEESAERAGMTLEELTEQDRKFWSFDDE